MDIFFFFMILIYSIFPIWIIMMIPQTLEKEIKVSRMKHAIPAVLLTLINISGIIYCWYFGKNPFMMEGTYLFLIPPLLLLLVVIVWNSGRREEKLIQMEIAEKEIEQVRFQKGTSNRQIITSSDDIEML